MKKIAIFTEGQTEAIFVRELLLRIVNASKMRLQCVELLAHTLSGAYYEHRCPDPEIYFLIIDVHGDEGVVSSIKDREVTILETQGFEQIIGLRDMYCDIYNKLSPGTINQLVSDAIKNGCRSTIDQLNNADRIKLFFAVMEIEAWFLAMYNLFEKIDSLLTKEYINANIGYNLEIIDPQTEFFKPTDKVKDIMNLCGQRYRKTKSEIERIAHRMSIDDLDDARENGRCDCFDGFYNEIATVASGYLY